MLLDLFEEELAPVAAAVAAPAIAAPAPVAIAPLCTRKPGYVLPAPVESGIWLIPVSGGADSTALAILLHEMFPEVPWRLVFTDTGAEEPEIYETLDRLEVYLGKKIDRVLPERDMWQLLADYGNYLPSSQARWCTRMMKAEPFKIYLEQFAGLQKYVYVGIRADEATRVAFTLDQATTEMPFVDLDWKRADVFNKLRDTIGIPRFYSRRSRSGCSSCFYQRRQELVGLLQECPAEFAKGEACEKLSERDAARHDEAPDLGAETRIARNWLNLPMPKDGDAIDGKVGCKGSRMFGERGIYVGAEFFTDGAPGMGTFVWKHRIVSYSTTLSGLKRQLNTRFEHLLATAEAQDMEEWDIRNQVKFAIYYIEASDAVFDPDGPGIGSYTWHSGESYR